MVVLSAMCGCAATPLSHDSVALDARMVSWTRGADAQPFLDQHGVCHAFSHDHQGALRTLGTQVKACFEGTLPTVAVTAPSTNAVKVTWQQVPASRIDELFAETPDNRLLNAAGRRKASVFAVNGFYEVHGDTCYVVVADREDRVSTLGHEFKHCVDGDFHDERGVWRQHRAG
jgi:hypothetical protein